ncbi:radical SAM protein [Geobacillus thermodenitrificans]|uniref:radical SAM/SPASM domain-containing protein n=1 Tax=Geobacillus thermodenitrificans TaxID=33940 RepID=UPI0034C63796
MFRYVRLKKRKGEVVILRSNDIVSLTNDLLFQVDGQFYLFHGLSGVISELSPLGETILRHIPKRGISFGNLCHLLKQQYPAELIEEVVEEFIDQGIVTKNHVRKEVAQTPGVPIGSLPIQTLVFHLINECNLGCMYCYAGGGDYGKPMRAMDQKTAEQALHFLMRSSGDLPRLSVVLFGGEPTLHWELVKHVVEYGKQLAQSYGKKIDFSITTNATLLTERRIDFLTQHEIGVSVSIDGDEAVQNQWRPFKNGMGSYNIVSKNVKKLVERYRHRPIAARVTLTKHFPPIRDTFFHLLHLGFYEVGFAPVTDTEEAFVLNSEELNRLLDDFEELTQLFIEEAARDRYLGFSNLAHVLIELHKGMNKAYGCGAGIGFFAVSPKGELFLCHRFNEQQNYRLGDIYTGIDRDVQQKWLGMLHVDNKTTCSRCPLKHTCAGGCYYEAKERMGEISSPNLHYCQWMKRWYTIALKAYVQIMKSNPAFLDRIAGIKDDCRVY